MSFEFEEKIKNFLVQNFRFIFIILVIVLAFFVRVSMFSFESGDYHNALSPWYDTLDSHPWLSAYEENFDNSNYTPPYLYLLKIATKLPYDKIVNIKLISILFDFILAYFVLLIVRRKYGKESFVPFIAFFILLFTPTILVNSALWGQCDSIYAAFAIGSIYFLLEKKYFFGFLFFAIALSFKFQAAFLLPFLIFFYFKNKISFLYFLLIPAVYVLMMIPAWVAGRPMMELLSIYISQSNYYHELTLNSPTLYQWVSNDYYDIFYRAGGFLTVSIQLLILTLVVLSSKKWDKEMLVKLAFISVLTVPFFMPKMHERYFYMADILSIIFAFYFPRYFYVAVLVTMASFFSYLPFLFHMTIIPVSWLSLVMLGSIVDVIRELTYCLLKG